MGKYKRDNDEIDKCNTLIRTREDARKNVYFD